MSAVKETTYIATMFVLGIVLFAIFAWLVEYRQGQPIAAAAQVDVAGDPLGVLAAGVGISSKTAIADLAQGARSKAVHAIDAAMRVAEVGRHAAQGTEKQQFEEALNRIKSARRSLQNGSPAHAPELLRQAIAALQRGGNIPGRKQDPVDSRWKDYKGAIVLNAPGVRIGKLESIEQVPQNGAQATIVVGGSQNVLGVFDFGGKRLTIPADRIVFGKAQAIGSVVVSLPTFATTAAAIANEQRVVQR